MDKEEQKQESSQKSSQESSQESSEIDNLLHIDELFSDSGKLAEAFDGFIKRDEQLEMAQAIEKSFKNDKSICIEAGTGTGKTFAYLVPALKAFQQDDKQSIISTGTKNLQDQLFFRDLPNMSAALGVSPRTALLKGRNNYLCEYRMNQNLDSGRFSSRSMVDTLQRVKDWSTTSSSGDLTQCPDLADNDPLWSYLTSTNDNCLGAECPDYAECYVLKARQKALGADLVVVNHHLLLADMVLKEDGFGELLPDAELVIVDEAHQLSDIAHSFYGRRFASRQLAELCRDTELEAMTNAKDDRQLSVGVRRVEGALSEIRLSLGETGKKVNWKQVVNPQITKQFNDLREEVKMLHKRLIIHASRSKGLDSCEKRCGDILTTLTLFDENEQAFDAVRWLETYRQGFAVVETPLDVAESFEQSRLEQAARSWVFTSATITQADKFEHFSSQLGLDSAEKLFLASPFDYENQSLLHIPRGVCDPRGRDYTDSWLQQVLPLIKANPGGTFVLFTSYYAMHKVRDALNDSDELELKNKLLVQGELPKTELIDAFRSKGDGILLATSSFWEGVDVKGLALSLVIIDKLPFTAPDEPLIEAKIQALRKNGKNPFFDLQIPEAITALKQGAGRLIRDQKDKGVLVLCDPRIIANRYGKEFLQSLPAMPRTRSQATVISFLEQLK